MPPNTITNYFSRRDNTNVFLRLNTKPQPPQRVKKQSEITLFFKRKRSPPHATSLPPKRIHVATPDPLEEDNPQHKPNVKKNVEIISAIMCYDISGKRWQVKFKNIKPWLHDELRLALVLDDGVHIFVFKGPVPNAGTRTFSSKIQDPHAAGRAILATMNRKYTFVEHVPKKTPVNINNIPTGSDALRRWADENIPDNISQEAILEIVDKVVGIRFEKDKTYGYCRLRVTQIGNKTTSKSFHFDGPGLKRALNAVADKRKYCEDNKQGRVETAQAFCELILKPDVSDRFSGVDLLSMSKEEKAAYEKERNQYAKRFALQLYKGMKSSTKERNEKRLKAGKKLLDDVEWKTDNKDYLKWLEELVRTTEGLCHISRHPYKFYGDSGYSMSPERLDNEITYTKDNTRLICRFFQSSSGASQWTPEKFQSVFKLRRQEDSEERNQWLDKQIQLTEEDLELSFGQKSSRRQKGGRQTCDLYNKLRTLIKSAKRHTSQRNDHGRNHPAVEIDVPYLLELVEEHRLRCQYSKIAMNIHPHSKWLCSLERIDDTKGYAKGNVALVAHEFNHCCAKWSPAICDEFWGNL